MKRERRKKKRRSNEEGEEDEEEERKGRSSDITVERAFPPQRSCVIRFFLFNYPSFNVVR